MIGNYFNFTNDMYRRVNLHITGKINIFFRTITDVVFMKLVFICSFVLNYVLCLNYQKNRTHGKFKHLLFILKKETIKNV